MLGVCVEIGHTGEQPDEVVGDVGDGGHCEGLCFELAGGMESEQVEVVANLIYQE